MGKKGRWGDLEGVLVWGSCHSWDSPSSAASQQPECSEVPLATLAGGRGERGAYTGAAGVAGVRMEGSVW